MSTNDPRDTPSESPRSTDGRSTDGRTTDGRATDDRTTTHAPATDRRSVRDRQKERFGGVKVGCAFFGWLTATGMAVVLTALLAALGAGVGLGTGTTSVNSAADAASGNGVSTADIGWIGAIVLLAVIFVAYYCGGYVAGRMARFDGMRQGVAVWVWSVVVAVLVAVLGAVAGSQLNVLDQLNSFPRIPSSLSGLSAQGLVALVGVVVASLVGAVLGGLAGMNFHRRVDKAGLGR